MAKKLDIFTNLDFYVIFDATQLTPQACASIKETDNPSNLDEKNNTSTACKIL